MFPVTTAVVLVRLATALRDLARYCELRLSFFRRLLGRLDFPRIDLKMIQTFSASFLDSEVPPPLFRRVRYSSPPSDIGLFPLLHRTVLV